MDRKLALTIQFAALDRLSGPMRKIIGLGDSGATMLAKMKREARDLDNQLKDVRARLASGSMQGGLLMAERELVKAIEDTNRAMKRRQQMMAIDNKVTKIKAQGEAYKASGRDNIVGGASMLAPFILAGKQAMDFSSGMVDIQQKADLTNAATAKMAGNILSAARAAHQLPEPMREAVDVLSGKGLDPRQAVKLIAPIGRLGTAFKVELADGAAAAFANINNLKVPLAETAKAFDIMAAGGNAGAFEVADMARHFPSLTARMQALGQTGTPAVADLTAALQMAMNTAGSADEAGNNIANLLAKINSPATIKAFEKNFGVDLPSAMKKFQAQGMTSMEAFAEVTKKATGGDMKKLGFVVEDQQAQMGLLALMQNMDAYRKMRADIMKSGGTVDRAFDQRELNDASVAWTSFKGQIATSAILMGTTLLPAASRFFGMLNNILGGLSTWAQANPRLASGIMSLVAGVALARVGLGVLQYAFGSILGPMATAWGWWQKYKTLGSVAAVFPRLAKGFGMVRTAALFMAKGVARAGMLMLANPMVLAITAIVLAIGVAGYLIYRHWDTIKAAFASAGAWLGQAWTTLKARFMAFPALFGPIGMVAGFVIRHWGAIKGAFAAGAGMIGQGWQAIKQGAVNGLTWFAGLNVRMWQIGIQIIQGLVRGIQSAPGAVWNALKAIVFRGVDGIKAYLGIKSPSRLFAGIGGFMTEGLERGIDRGAEHPLGAMNRLAAGVAAAMAIPAMAALSIEAPDVRLPRSSVAIPSSIERPVAPRLPTLAPMSLSIADPSAPRMPGLAQLRARSIIEAPAAPTYPASAELAPIPLGFANPAAPRLPALDGLRLPASIERPDAPAMPALGALSARMTIAPPAVPALPALGSMPLAIGTPALPRMPALGALRVPSAIDTPSAPAMPSIGGLSARMTIAAPVMPALAMPNLPALDALRIGTAIDRPVAPPMPALDALRTRVSFADPAAPRMPALSAQTIGAAIQAPDAPAMPAIDAMRFASLIDAPSLPDMPSLGRLRIGVDVDDPTLPRMPALRMAVASRQDPAANEGADSRPQPVRPMARMATAVPLPGRSDRAPAPARREGDTYHISITQLPGEDGEAMAKRIMDKIKRSKRDDGLGEYGDE